MRTGHWRRRCDSLHRNPGNVLRTGSVARRAAGWVLLVVVTCGGAQGEDAPGETAQPFLKMIRRFELRDASGVALKLESKALLNWTNPERQTNAGSLFLWTSGGLPAATACIYPTQDNLYDVEFHSLGEGRLSGSSDRQVVWAPEEAGLEYTFFKSSRGPAAAAPTRLVQMRQLARRFSATLIPPQRVEKPLRLLPSPVFRYPATASKRSQVIDGAIFAFVQGTDPEVLLLIEALDDPGGTARWRYGLARMSIVPTKVELSGETVWETNWARSSPNTAYTVLSRQRL